MTNRHALLLTSTIVPKAPFDKGPRSNPNIRIQDYLQSLKFWAGVRSNYISSIVFCDNSGYDLSVLEKSIERLNPFVPIEFLSYESPPLPDGMHYGYGELELMSYAVKNSFQLSQSPYFIKVTGRLRFKNIDRLLDCAPNEYDAMADCRGIHRHEIGLPLRVRTQIVLFRRKFFLHYIDPLISVMPQRRDSHLEEFLAYCLLRANCEDNTDSIYYRFPIGCNPIGISGSGNNYQSLQSFLKSEVSKFVRRYFPALYI